MFDGLNKDIDACMRKFDSMVQHVSQVLTVGIAIETLCFSDSVDVNGFQECIDLQSEYGKSTSSEEVSGSSPLGHEEQCCLNSIGVDFAATSSKMKLSSIKGSLRNLFQGQKNESFDDSHVRQSSFIAEIASDFSNLSHQEQGDETKDTLPTANEILKGLICNGRQHGAATVSAYFLSQFSQQDKSILTTLGVDQAETSTTTSLVAGEVSTKLICNDGDQTRQLDLSADYISLQQLDQDRLRTQEEERDNMSKIELPEVESVPKKGVSGNQSHVRHTNFSGDRAKQTIVPSQAKKCSNHSRIYDKRGSVRSNNKRHKEEKYIAWLDYGATVEWKFELTADQKILKSLAGQWKRRCTRAYAKLFGSTPKRIGAFHVEKIVAKKDGDMKPKVNENREYNEDNRLKNDEAEIEVIKPIKNDRSNKKGSKTNDSGTVSSATMASPVLKRYGSQFQVVRNKIVTSPMNSQGQSFSTVTKEVKSKDVIYGSKVQDVEKRKVNSTFSSPISNGQFSPKSGLSINMAQEQRGTVETIRGDNDHKSPDPVPEQAAVLKEGLSRRKKVSVHH
ncbi:OLC1v1022677C1 [Oldenlandia corymbosa var. corymbosa]|uniref:OLC1v1022677C1 n=1 Tax=Oldenlandia corymbosa var. corymbosa TaxID=529605 RepID=A0AAV1BYD2_OLDCO|nr:OLC1v1022677C1 [Oldenlandia corymbosa var. corymbosa]